ncbi:MAG TPA: ABC transporter ATP-binding protein [Candidatus Rifleibacterium sp.]|nr:ABC transporter ATP-binding protein [Candidatus Rifleibacterium sp.]HPT45456.1 ABC transporter ATP-binding protein [Candidatus Rifleibacterium sp.]
MTELLVAEEISKIVGWLKKETIVDHVSINLHEGEIMGLLGPNGAGKTTTMKMLLGLTSISSGTARMFGAPVPTPASRVGVGFLPEAIQHPDHLSVYEYVRFHARLSGINDSIAKIEEHLRQVDMWEYRDRLLKECSKGMRQRADVARILLRQARLIFLDEPFSGLDPCGQVMLKELLMSLKKQNISILVNSHAAGILADVCDRVCVMNKGKIVVNEPLEKLLKTSQTRVVASFADSAAATAFAAARPGLSGKQKEPAVFEFILDDRNGLNEMAGAIIAAGGRLIEMTPVMLTLDQLFVKTLSIRNDEMAGGLS